MSAGSARMACLLGRAEGAQAAYEQAHYEPLLAFDAAFFTSFFAAFLASLDQPFLEHLLIEAGLFEIGLGELEHDADLVSGEFGEFVDKDGLYQVDRQVPLVVRRLLGEQGAGLLHCAGRVEYGQACEPCSEAGTGVVWQLGEVDSAWKR